MASRQGDREKYQVPSPSMKDVLLKWVGGFDTQGLLSRLDLVQANGGIAGLSASESDSTRQFRPYLDPRVPRTLSRVSNKVCSSSALSKVAYKPSHTNP